MNWPASRLIFTSQLTQLLRCTTSYQRCINYIHSVLKPGASHKDNNLKYVSDHIFILENFDFNAHRFTQHLKTPAAQASFAYNLVEDLNRHLTLNLDLPNQEVQLLFAK